MVRNCFSRRLKLVRVEGEIGLVLGEKPHVRHGLLHCQLLCTIAHRSEFQILWRETELWPKVDLDLGVLEGRQRRIIVAL